MIQAGRGYLIKDEKTNTVKILKKEAGCQKDYYRISSGETIKECDTSGGASGDGTFSSDPGSSGKYGTFNYWRWQVWARSGESLL